MSDGGTLGALHDYWADTAALTALVPAARVFTGRVPGGTAEPYVAIVPAGKRQAIRTNSGKADWRTVQFQVISSTFASGEAIADAIIDALDRKTLPDAPHALGHFMLQPVTPLQPEEILPDGWWVHIVPFEFLETVET
jgi:hypothetical protein